MSNTDRIYVLLDECRRMGIQVLPPDVNESRIDFTVVEKKIRFGLLAVKNVGEGTCAAIVEEREKGGRYATLADLVSRIPSRSLNRRTLESLVASGACDSLEGSRAQKFEGVEAALEFGSKVLEKSSSHDLFAAAGNEIKRVAPELPQISEWSSTQKLAEEKKALGFYISGHPLDQFRDELNSFTSNTIANLNDMTDGREVTIGGILTKLNTKMDKKSNMMAFATIEDYTGQLETIIFSDSYEKFKDILTIEKMILVTGRLSTREGEAAKVIVNEVVPLEKLGERFNCQLVIKVDKLCTDKIIESALSSLEKYSGPVPVILAARENGSEVFIKSRKYSVNIDFQLLNALKELLGETGAYLRPLGKKDAILQ
jgi:DNA polymerase-3 subunit alpha